MALSLAAVLAGKNASGISNEYTGSTANGRCYHTPFCQRMHLGGQYTRSNQAATKVWNFAANVSAEVMDRGAARSAFLGTVAMP